MLKTILKRTFSTHNTICKLGDIPKALQYDREFQMTQLENGVRVCSEIFPSEVVSLNVFINCGSRQETKETSGSAHFLEHLHFKGTHKRSRLQLELDVENMGGSLNAYTSRENTSYTLNCFPNKMDDAMDILSDMLLNSKYTSQSLESERDTIFRELIETQKQFYDTINELSHLTSFPDHQMGLPILGSIQNIQNISRDMVVEYHDNYYKGENIVVVGTGNLDHDQLVELTHKYFGSISRNVSYLKNSDKPEFKNQIQVMKASLLEVPPEGIHVGIMHEAPSWNDADFYGFLIVQRILLDKPELELEKQLYFKSDINYFQKIINNVYLEEQKSGYTPYADTGLFGNYYYTNGHNLQELVQLNSGIYSYLVENLREVELERAKNRLYVEILQHESVEDIAQSIGNHVLYLKRRISNQEMARRVQSYTVEDMKRIVEKWLQSNNYSITVWGNIDPLLEKYSSQ